jgi:nickel transport protein
MLKKLFVLILSLISFSYAHDLWIEKSKGKYILYYGHKYSSHKGKELIKYNPNSIQTLKCITENGKEKDLNIKRKYPLVIDENCAIIYVDVSTGYWTKTPYGTVNKPKNQVDMPVRSWLSYESVKRINQWNENLKKPFVKKLDIIPINNPLRLETGDKVRLLITFEEKPAKNVPVAYEGKFRGVTDSKGRINIRIKHKGLQLIEATYKKPVNSEKADEIIYTTTLNFEVK